MSPEVVQLGPIILLLLLLSIIFIVYATAKWKLHPFLSIISSAYIFALLTNLVGTLNGVEKPLIADIGKEIAGGFGSIITSIGLVIIFGTLIGKILENSGAAVKMAEVVSPARRSSPCHCHDRNRLDRLDPCFCDSGYVILSSLKKSLAKKTGVSAVTLAVALSTGLYATHTLVPLLLVRLLRLPM